MNGKSFQAATLENMLPQRFFSVLFRRTIAIGVIPEADMRRMLFVNTVIVVNLRECRKRQGRAKIKTEDVSGQPHEYLID